MPLSVLRYEHPFFVLQGDSGQFKVDSRSLSDARKNEMQRLAKGGLVPADKQASPSAAITQPKPPPQKLQGGGEAEADTAPNESPVTLPDYLGGGPPTRTDLPPYLGGHRTLPGERGRQLRSPEAISQAELQSPEYQAQVARREIPEPAAPAVAQPTVPPQPVSAAASPAIPGLPPMPGGAAWGEPKRLLEEGLTQGKRGAQEQAEAQSQQAELMATAYQRQIKGLDALEANRVSETQKAQGQIDQLIADIQNPEHAINAEHFWENKGTWGKVSTAIGLVLSGMGSGLTGAPNMAAQFLQRNIDRDIEAQKANLQKKETLLGFMFKKYGNIQDAALATRAHLMASVAAEVGLAGARSGSAQAKAAADLLQGQLTTAAVGPMAQIIQGQHQDAWQRYQLKFQRWMFEQFAKSQEGGGGQGPRYIPSNAPAPMISDLSIKGMSELQKARAERMVHLPEANAVTFAPDAETARKLNASIPSYHVMDQELSIMEQLGKKHAWDINAPWPTEDKSRFDVAQDAVNLHMNRLVKQQRFTHEENEIYQPMIGNKKTFLLNGKAGGVRIQALKALVNRERVADYQSIGLQMGAPKTQHFEPIGAQ